MNIDLVAGLIAILLPWTTTGVAIAAVLWIVALAFACEPRELLRSLVLGVGIAGGMTLARRVSPEAPERPGSASA